MYLSKEELVEAAYEMTGGNIKSLTLRANLSVDDGHAVRHRPLPQRD
jgi:hypothetical protein